MRSEEAVRSKLLVAGLCIITVHTILTRRRSFESNMPSDKFFDVGCGDLGKFAESVRAKKVRGRLHVISSHGLDVHCHYLRTNAEETTSHVAAARGQHPHLFAGAFGTS